MEWLLPSAHDAAWLFLTRRCRWSAHPIHRSASHFCGSLGRALSALKESLQIVSHHLRLQRQQIMQIAALPQAI
jgi:hypothetical protein